MELFLPAWAIKRPNKFNAPEALVEKLCQAKGLGRWVPNALETMAQAMLRPHATEEEGWEEWRLRCPRELEAVGYISNAYTPVWAGLEQLRQHAKDIWLIGGDPHLEGAWYPCVVNPLIAAQFGFKQISIPGTGHLPQLEQPEQVIAEIISFLGARPQK